MPFASVSPEQFQLLYVQFRENPVEAAFMGELLDLFEETPVWGEEELALQEVLEKVREGKEGRRHLAIELKQIEKKRSRWVTGVRLKEVNHSLCYQSWKAG